MGKKVAAQWVILDDENAKRWVVGHVGKGYQSLLVFRARGDVQAVQ
jgi:hypothetical protein